MTNLLQRHRVLRGGLVDLNVQRGCSADLFHPGISAESGNRFQRSFAEGQSFDFYAVTDAARSDEAD